MQRTLAGKSHFRLLSDIYARRVKELHWFVVSWERPGRLLNAAQGQTVGRQVEKNNGNNGNSLRNSKQRRHRGHSVLYRSTSCPLEKSRKQSRHKILKGTRVEESRKQSGGSFCSLRVQEAAHDGLMGTEWNCLALVGPLTEYVNLCFSCDGSVTQVWHGALGMFSLWCAVVGWRPASDWENSDWLHGPDSYSFQLRESMGIFVCVHVHVCVCVCAWAPVCTVCAWNCASALALSFPLQRRHCPVLGRGTPNVTNCPSACPCICGSMCLNVAYVHLMRHFETVYCLKIQEFQTGF